MANCHEYSKQGEGENARETKNGRNVERRRRCLRCGEIMYPAVVVMLSETFFVRAEQVLIHNIFSLFKSMWLLGQICKSQVDPQLQCILALKLNKFHFVVLRVQYLRLKFRCCQKRDCVFFFLKYIKLPPNWSTFDEIPEMIDLKRLAPFPDLFATEKTRIVRLLFMCSIQYHKEAGRG